ncbi:hypothetical protein [Amycolatopsis sp. NPDC051102]|uniref:hypothetical protein n=1 Tax=Amycolatopsis sp. NPDC051102 TaxID=3155163 RepID=UPI003419400F
MPAAPAGGRSSGGWRPVATPAAGAQRRPPVAWFDAAGGAVSTDYSAARAARDEE